MALPPGISYDDAVARQLVNQLIVDNNNNEITPSKLRQSLITGILDVFKGNFEAALEFIALGVESASGVEANAIAIEAYKIELQQAAALARVFQGSWNVATNTPNLAGLGLNNTTDKGKFWIVSVAGTTSLSGTSVNAVVGDEYTWNGTAWVYGSGARTLVDPRKSPNLILSSNSTPENWLNSGANTDAQPVILVQTQPATITLVKGAKGLGFMWKCVMQPNSRVNYFSNKISLDALPVGEKVHLGYFRYLSAGTVLSASTVHKLWPLPENVDANITMETIDLGNGLQYVRSVNPITVPTYTSRCEVRIYIYAAAGSVADGEVWFGSPALIKTQTPLAALMYMGGEDMSSVPSPMISQNLIAFANLTPDQWILNTSASSIGDKPIVYRQSGTVASITALKKFREFSFGVKATGMQLSSRINFISQIIKTNESIAPGTMVSFGFFLFIGTNVDISQVTCQLVDATSIGVGASAFTMEFVDLGNGFRYYRSVRPIAMPTYASNQACASAYIYTGAASVTGDVYLISPSLVKSSQKLQPQSYLGLEDSATDVSGLQTQITTNQTDIVTTNTKLALVNTNLRNNYIKDAGFLAQSIGATALASPWGLGGVGGGLYQAPFVFELVSDGPAGTRALKQTHSKRSSDSLFSVCTVNQTVVVPDDHKGMAKFSYGMWVKRDSLLVIPTSFTITFYPNLGDTTGSSTTTPAVPSLGTSLNTWIYLKFENITVPAGTSRMNIRSSFRADPASVADVTCNIWMQTFEVAFNSTVANATNQNFKVIDPEYFGLRDKKLCMYGDSITAADVTTVNALLNEALAIANRFLMTLYVRGVGGTRVTDNGSIAWFDANGLYLARPDSSPPGTQPPGSLQWNSSMSALERINNTIPADTDIIFIRGLTNDYLNYPLGTIDSAHDNNTIYGAYQLMLDRIYARIPNALVILATPTHRNGEDTDVGTGGAAGLKFEQVREAVRVIAKKYKYVLCDMSDSNINQLNHATYLSDGIHPNTAGYARTTAVIFKTLKSIYYS